MSAGKARVKVTVGTKPTAAKLERAAAAAVAELTPIYAAVLAEHPLRESDDVSYAALRERALNPPKDEP